LKSKWSVGSDETGCNVRGSRDLIGGEWADLQRPSLSLSVKRHSWMYDYELGRIILSCQLGACAIFPISGSIGVSRLWKAVDTHSVVYHTETHKTYFLLALIKPDF
jgi:hypothetical protein